jgi:hypothetical protein
MDNAATISQAILQTIQKRFVYQWLDNAPMYWHNFILHGWGAKNGQCRCYYTNNSSTNSEATSVGNSWENFSARSTKNFGRWRKSSAPHKVRPQIFPSPHNFFRPLLCFPAEIKVPWQHWKRLVIQWLPTGQCINVTEEINLPSWKGLAQENAQSRALSGIRILNKHWCGLGADSSMRNETMPTQKREYNS